MGICTGILCSRAPAGWRGKVKYPGCTSGALRNESLMREVVSRIESTP